VRVLLTADAWNTLVDAAAATDVTSARYGGEILEAAAHELGWRAR
jgi:hypothetical protein